MFGQPWKRISVFSIVLAICALAVRPVPAEELGSGTLAIAGTRLEVSPDSQTVPFNTPTIVETKLAGLEDLEGALPSDLRVLADFTGLEIDGVLVLETVPGEPFRIPRLSLKGQYQLDNIRLVQGDDLLAYAEPRSAGVLVTQVLVTRVTSRPLTLDEIRSYGVVVGDQNFQAFNFTFGFAVGGDTFDYNLPVLYSPVGGGRLQILTDLAQAGPGGSTGTTAPRFQPPQMAPFNLKLEPRADGAPVPTGGCADPEGDCFEDAPVTLPGVILFPTDVTLLHQFFSVVLLAKNDAPPGDALRIRDLAARVVLPPGLRMAETEPPTPLGVPVPVRVPGADGRLGTADDLTFLVAQAEGSAEVVVEGLKQGTHIVEFQLDGTLEGLPGNEVRRISGTARGAVVVRDPTLSMTITHPDVVRTGEPYMLQLTVSNTSAAPVNLLSVTLPATGLSGVELAAGETNQKTIPTLLPGDAEVVQFRLVSRRTGRVVASSVRSASAIDPRFELVVGVGEEGIPLSPTALVLPRSTDVLPEPLVRRGLALLGLGWSLATAPAALQSGLPRPGLENIHEKVYWLAQAGRHVSLGEAPFDSLAVLALEWTGARDRDWEWDDLRRRTQKGGLWADEIGKALSSGGSGTSTPLAVLDRFAATTAFLGPLHGALAVGTGARIEVESRASGKAIAGLGTDPARRRDLPFADLFNLDMSTDGQMVTVAVPDENGYRARLRIAGGGTAGLHLLVPGPGGSLRRASWTVTLSANGVATADFKKSFSNGELVLQIDADGDGVAEETEAGAVVTIAPRPFKALSAVQNPIDPSGHMIEILFTQDVDLRSLLPSDPNRFRIPGKVSNGGLVPIEEDIANFFETLHENPFKGLRDTRIVRVVFDNPISPLVDNEITIQDLESVSGQPLAADNRTLPVTTTLEDEGVEVRGTVYGPDGQPVPFARVELYEVDFFYHFPTPCRQHKTAAVQADASGRFHFDYVRQTACGDVFTVSGADPSSGRHGSSRARVRFAGGTMEVDIVMLGRGTIRGKVRYEDGSIPSALDVIAYSPVFFEGREARLGPDGTYEVGDIPVGTVTLGANDRQGGYVFQTVEVPAAGAVVQRDLTIIRRPPTRAVGEVRGVVYETDGTTPVYNAYLSLYVNGELVGVERSGFDGRFDFGVVPAGLAEIEAFDGETGLSGAQVQIQIPADQVKNVTLLLRDDRGTVEGHVYQQTLSTVTPLAGVVVWVSGTPFNTVTDENGFYRLDGVFAGDRTVLAADLENNRQTSAQVSLTGNGAVVTRDLYFVQSVGSGLAGEVIGFSGNPVPGAKVHLSAGGDQWFGEAVTDAAGRFAFPNLQVGTYVVHAVKGLDGGTQQATIRFQGETPFVRVQFKKGTIRGSVKARNESGQLVGVTALVTYRTTVVRDEMVGLDYGAHTIETAANGTFELPNVLTGRYVLTVSNAFHGEKTVRGELVFAGEVAEHDFEFERNGVIRGVVLDQDGAPAAGATVFLRHPNFSVYDLTTDAEGRFKFELVPPGGRFPIDATWSSGTVSRQARVWVNFNEFGQELDVEIRLPRQGAVGGYVEDANGNPVPGAVVTLQEHAFPQRSLIQNADGEGHFSYTNIFAGTVSLSAKAPSLGGLGAKTTVEITAEGEEVLALLTLQATGEIVGRVLSPENGQPVATAQATLYRGSGLFDTVTTGADGTFRFRLLPMGDYTVWAFDPRVGRHGRSPALTLQQNNQVLSQDVRLEARGNVLGHLYEPSSTVGIPGATVRLDTRSLAPFTTFSSTDVDGAFTFEGIPEGVFRLSTKEPEGRRRAAGEGEVTEEDEDVTVNLYLEESGRVLGSVKKPAGVPADLFPNANTLIYQDGQVVGATLDNPFSFDGIIADRPFELRSFEVGGDHRAARGGRLAEQDEEVTLDLQMVPLGSAAVTVRDSFGNPVAGAAVTVNNNGFYGSKYFQGSTAADGRVAFSGAGEGSLSVYATHPVTGLRGSGSGTLTQEGQVVEIAVQLENSGRVRGRAVLADGVTPAADALVVVTSGGRTLQALAGADGSFSFASVRLGTVSLFIQEHLGPGQITRGGTLSTNGQEIDFGVLTLDGAPPFVTALTPASGARDLPLSTAVAVVFSEALDRARFAGDWLTFRTLSGRPVAFTVAWEAGDTKMVLTPTAPLTSFTGYEVIVQNAFDLAGRALTERVKTVFHTVDVVPPNVVDMLPRDGQSQVPVDTQVKVTFTEPVAAASLSGNAFQLTDLTTGQGITTTFLQLAGEREVLLTPVGALVANHRYQVRVQGVQDKGGNTMAQPVVTTFWTPDTIPPQIQSILPAQGTTYTAGDRIPVAVEATDERGLGAAALSYSGWTFTDGAAPYAWSVPAPVVSTASDVVLTVKVKDIFGNESTATRTVRVEPRVNGNAPQVEIACAENGDAVVPGVDAELILTASDDEGIESHRFLVNGQVVRETTPVDQATAEASFLWAPPNGAAAGTSYLVRIEARDFAGNVGVRELTVSIPAGTILKGSRSVSSTHTGQPLVLADGTFTIRDPLSFPALTLVRGATLVTPDEDSEMAFTVTGALRMQCGATLRPGAAGAVRLTLGSAKVAAGALIDGTGRGYAGGTGGHPDGYAPAGVPGASGTNAAGSHGGHGAPAGNGAVYGSITEPRLGGGGGATGTFSHASSAGGGIVELTVTGDLALHGELRSLGADGCGGGAGAGGSVLVRAATVRGGGLIDASGGSHAPGCYWSPGAGGGGRVAVHGALDGFDPAAQARAWGGKKENSGAAAPGTVYFKTPQQTHGVLVIDRGDASWNRAGGPTVLPTLATGGYRFDRVELRNGAALQSTTPVVATDLALGGEVSMSGTVQSQNLTLASGAVLRPLTGGEVHLAVPGRLTVAAGARIDVSDLGYAGGWGSHADGFAPEHVAGASGPNAGGAHGGRGLYGTSQVFDSVYDPRLAGGGGAKGDPAASNGWPGGGVVRIEAGEVVLDGELRASAKEACKGGGGAGGTISLRTGILSGTGLINASGSDASAGCFYNAGAAGGGRVSLVAETFAGFDPAAQVKVWGGAPQQGDTFAAPGTLYYRLPEHQWGVLVIDNGQAAGADRTGPLTQLPILGGGPLTGFETIETVEPDVDDAWIARAGGFTAEWRGVWVKLTAGSTVLGTYEAIDLAGGRLRLAGAGGLTGATGYAGEYRFDRIDLLHGSGYDASDPVSGSELVIEGNAEVGAEIRATNVRIKSGAVVKPATGRELRFVVSGKLTVEAGAKVDVTTIGYAGGTGGHPDGLAPDGVPGASGLFAGGAHGGRGIYGSSQVFDSVYEPRLAGGGGAKGYEPGHAGAPGGGILRIEAGEVELQGELLAGARTACGGGAGAGGAVHIRTGALGGSGTIDASGGSEVPWCAYHTGPGGGGRVSLVASSFQGFDPAAQVKTWGGVEDGNVFAAPGTIYYRLPEHQWGVLLIDNGQANGVDRSGPLTQLPALGGGPLTGFATIEPEGTDAWIARDGGFTAAWRGVWVKLTAGSTVLGTYEAVELGGDGRLRLAGAGGLTGATGYAGEYRFDRIDVLHGSGYDATDPIGGAELVIEGNAEVNSEIRAFNVRIKSGAVVKPATGGELRIIASGTLTVEAGAVIDLQGRGYAGGTGAHPDGFSPSWVAGATGSLAGGAHGGRGLYGASQVFDSVYEPRLGGGGGARGGADGQAGGGILRIEAGAMVLDGQLRASGPAACHDGGGGGGTVSIETGTLSGTGLIDASGSDELSYCGWNTGPGGGGRVSLVVDALAGFDPAAQVRVWGGKINDGPTYAAPGTLFVKLPTHTWGDLRIDNGKLNGADRVNLDPPGPVTALPVLGSGSIASLTAEGENDARVGRSTPFTEEWRGAWMALFDAAGVELGVYRVADVNGQGRALLVGAQGITASTYQGEYRFDRVDVVNATLETPDRLVTPEFGGKLRTGSPIRGESLRLKAGSRVTPMTGGTLSFAVTGALVIESGVLIDVSHLGYGPGLAPAGVGGAWDYANGGTHGGWGGNGEFYDNLYEPGLAGGGGTGGQRPEGTTGGGVVRVEAGSLVLDGEIRARGQNACGGGGAAGGAVFVRTTGTLSGSGLIDASGGLAVNPGCGFNGNPGGGGRVALHAGSFSGFDPAVQVKVQGGTGASGAGTLLTRTSQQTWGSLRVDQRATTPDARATTPATIGSGTIGATYPGTAPADLWIEPQNPAVKFGLGVAGIWTRVNGVDYKVLALSADRRRILLQGAAGAVAVGQGYLGIYKVDNLTVAGRAKVEFKDGLVIAGSTTVEAGSTLIRPDIDPPVITITQPAAGTLYTSGQSVIVTATVTDMSSIASVTFRLGGRTWTDTAAPYTWSAPAPWVEAEGDVPIVVTALDALGSLGQATQTIRVRPLAAGNPPAVALTCPTPGALAAAGTSLDFYATATKDNGVERVELLLGSDPVALSADYEAPYVVRLTVPAGTAAGQVLQVKVRARGYDGVTAEVTYPVTVIAGSVLTADRMLTPSDLSLDGQSVIVAGGTLTVEGPHNFADLVVLDGARVTHRQTTTTQAYSLELDVDNQVYIACGGRIDVSDLGYREASAPPGVAPAADWANGGNHGGSGGIFGEYYDSVYQPWLPGAGGTAGGSLPGWPGGGAVLLDAGTVHVDGAIRARGQDACGGAGGAGGTVRIRTSGALRGAGQIDASGGVAKKAGCPHAGNAGGGGRIALHVGSFAGFDPAVQANVQGGTGGGASAGTLLTRTPANTWGDLRIDQRATSGTAILAVMPAVGRGIIGATYPGTEPGDLWIEPQSTSTKFSLGVAGIWVRINGVDYLIRELSADRRRILLQGAAGAVAAGQRYLGIYKFDSVTVTGWTRMEFKDGDVITGPVTVTPGSTLIRVDGTPPAITVTQPAAGTLYTSGDTVNITATASDASGVTSVTFRLGSYSFTDTSAPYQWTVAAPVVEAETDMPLVVSALDGPTNEIAINHMIRVRPQAAGNPPAVALTCPTPGALLAPGTGLDFYFTATSEAGIEKVELFLGAETTPRAIDLTAPYVLRFTAPAGALDGDVLQVKIRARSYNGGTAEVVYPVGVVTGSVLTADTTLAPTNLSLDGQSVVVAGGTLTLHGVHNFRDLVVLDGARLTHSETTASQVYKLEAGVQRDLYVACGGSIDVTGRGYLGAPANQRAYGYANSQAEGAEAQVGGSHGGRGGRFDGTSPVYGNLFDPRDPGAGGGRDGSTKGRDGGGAVRLTALGDVVVDGALLADGEAGSSGGGAGGSVRIDAGTLSGAGRIQANGSSGGNSNVGGGSGGRVALYASTIDAGLLSRTSAAGAKTTSTDASRWGAAGTIVVQRDVDPLGELILDNKGTASTQLTDLPAVRRGVVDAVGETGFTDNEADFRHGLAGLEVAFNDDLSTLYLVQSHGHHGQTLTLQVPVPPLSILIEPDDTYQGVYRFDRVTVRGGARALSVDRVDSTQPATVESGSEWTQSYTPTLQLTSPAAGAVFASGDTVSLAATVQDVLGVRDVVFKVGTATQTDMVSPWAATFAAPYLTEPADIQVSATATDHAGNRIVQSVIVRVEPVTDPVPPLVTLSCVVPGDAVMPGVAIAIPFVATDDRKIEIYRLRVDGQVVQTTPVGQVSVSTTLSWTPPANAAPGQVFALQIEAVDYGASVGSASLTLQVPPVAVRTGTQTLTSALNGTAVFLGAGTFTVQGTLSPSSLTLLPGARVISASGQAVRIATAGEVRVQCGASIDVTALGYPGTTQADGAGGAPFGVTPSVVDAGGSHGGPGAVWIFGPAGATFDSVYSPHLGGGGGSLRYAFSGYRSGAGGGIIDLTAGQLMLNGELKARGEERPARETDTPGAGGTVVVRAGVVQGRGTIDASGGNYEVGTSNNAGAGSGGGGRVALYVDAFQGFDPAAQVKAWGGTVVKNGLANRFAGPGTVFLKSPGDTYGRLVIDSGELAGGIDRAGPVTALPALGSGPVNTVEVVDLDLWIAAAVPFKTAPWLGAWVELLGAGGSSLGTFQATAIDGNGRVRLAGAKDFAATAASWRGLYLFDRIDLRNGAGVSATDPLRAATVQTDGNARLPQGLEAGSMTVKAGTALPVQAGTIRLKVTGTLHIETGAILDVTGLGYPGLTQQTGAGGAPLGVTPSAVDAGGSHGGAGSVWSAGPAGEIFDSVYTPQLGGGGGSLKFAFSGFKSGGGGGVIDLTAGQLVLDGQLRSRGEETPFMTADTPGAGGTVVVRAGSMSGAGTIDASGGNYTTGNHDAGSAGGGRVALLVDAFQGFDPLTQVAARGGTLLKSGSPNRYAGPGTVFLKMLGDTYGRLVVDQGGTGGRPIPNTWLPSIGVGTVGLTAAEPTVSGALWIEPLDSAAKFALGVAGMWVRIDGSDYRVIGQTTDRRRLLLAGAAGAVDVGDAYRGVYKFDEVTVRGGAKLELRDTNEVGTWNVDPTSSVIQNVP